MRRQAVIILSWYMQMIMHHIKDLDWIWVGGLNINNLTYADDTTMIADDEQKFQELIDVMVE